MSQDDSIPELRPIPDFPGYAASADGSIWTCRERGGPRQWRLGSRWTIMKPATSKDGYLRLTVTDAGNVRRCRFVHMLVLAAFAGPCPTGLQARHLDGKKLNCRADNLAWGTVQENHDDKQRHGTTARGERDGNAKLTADAVREIRELARQGVHLKTLHLRFGVTDVTIYHIVNRRTWKHVS